MIDEKRFAWWTVAALAAGGLSCGGDGATAALDAAYELGKTSSALALEAAASGRQVLDELELEPFTYRRTQEVDDLPTLTRVCGVRYRVSESDWGLVPDLSFPCDDEAAEEEALADARQRLEAHLSLPSSEYSLRAVSLATPGAALSDDGPGLVFARGLGVEVDLDECFQHVAERLAGTATALADLQCQTFLAPGLLLDELRDDLRQRAERARDLTAVKPPGPAIALSPDVARLCGAAAGAAGPAVPGEVAGTRTGGDVAHAIRLGAGQSVVIDLRSSAFDTFLTLFDGACSTQLASDDDGAGGSDSRLHWTSHAGGDHVLVVGSYGSSFGVGPYRLGVTVDSDERVLTTAEREALDGFVRWVNEAPEEEVQAAWRGGSGSDLQLGCLFRERFRSAAAARAAVAGEARSVCLAALEQATEARKAVLAAEE